MSDDHFKLYLAVFLIIKNSDGKILFERRSNTSYMDGKIQPPAGHLDGGEAASVAAAREASEELGISINPRDLKLTHTEHKPSSKQDSKEYINLFFEVLKFSGGRY